jgi:hypothetical protein
MKEHAAGSDIFYNQGLMAASPVFLCCNAIILSKKMMFAGVIKFI